MTQSAGAAFDAAALDAVKRFRFSPAEIDGKPAPVKITYSYQFTARVEAFTKGIFAASSSPRGPARRSPG